MRPALTAFVILASFVVGLLAATAPLSDLSSVIGR